MLRETTIALAATALLGLSAALAPTSASAYDDDYGYYCYYHRYDPYCWRYWHHDEDEDYDDDYQHHHHHGDHDRHGDHDHHHGDHDHDHDHDHGDDHD